MGKVSGDFDGGVNSGSGVDDSERVHEWEVGLPNLADITPLCQGLIPARLLSAFNIRPEPYRTAGDVAHASEQTLTSLRGTNFNTAVEMEVVGDELDEDDGDEMSESKKHRRNVSPEDADSAAAAAAEVGDGGDGDEKAAKRARLVWTPQLHKRFVDVVAHLGIKNAVPKTIMQLMNVEGLTRENVASHLQKYRLYLKRQGGGNNFESGPSNSSAEKSAAAAVESGGGEGGHGSAAPVPMPMMPVLMPMMGNYNGLGSHHTNNHHHYNYNHNYNHNHNQQQQYHQHQQYSSNGVMQTGNSNKYGGSVVSYHHNHLTHNYPPHVTPGDK